MEIKFKFKPDESKDEGESFTEILRKALGFEAFFNLFDIRFEKEKEGEL